MNLKRKLKFLEDVGVYFHSGCLGIGEFAIY
jgi:hypothetical protein